MDVAAVNLLEILKAVYFLRIDRIFLIIWKHILLKNVPQIWKTKNY